MAVDHDVTASPGKIVDVDLLAGDIVSPGDQLTVEPLDKVNAPVPPGHSSSDPTTPLFR